MTIKSASTLVAEALKQIKTISPSEALEKVNNNTCNLIDIRDVRELERLGRVENSSHIPRGMLEFWMDPDSQYFKEGKIDINKEILESAVIDGANRFERLRYIIIPHLMPLIIFVSLIHLMDSYRVFEEIVAFSSQAYVISLQWLTYDFLIPDETGNRLINRASTSAMLTMVGVSIIITPLLKRTWEDYREGKL